MEKSRLVLFLLATLLLSCNRSLKMEKQFDGEWNIESITEGFKEIKYDFNLNVINIIYDPKRGFLPSRSSEGLKNRDTTLKGYGILKKSGKYYVYFDTGNKFFNDTFEIKRLTQKDFILENEDKRIECTRMK